MKFLFACLATLTIVFGAQGQTEPDIDEVSLEMTQGAIDIGKPLGRAFKIILRKDGSAFFEGTANVGLIGKYEGVFSQQSFQTLAQFLISKKYAQISDELPLRMGAAAGVDRLTMYQSPTVITTVTRGKSTKLTRRPNHRDE